MPYDDPKLPTATLRGEQLFIAGDDEPYFRGPTQRVHFEVNDLIISGGYEPQDITDRKRPRIPTRESLRGKVKLEQGDRFAVGGMNVGEDVPIHFGLRPASDDEERFHWRSHIYFFRWDWERDEEARFRFFHTVMANSDRRRAGSQFEMRQAAAGKRQQWPHI